MTDQQQTLPVFRNRVIDKGQIRKLITWSFTHHGTARTAQMADLIKDLGFRYATKAGVSISVDDLKVPPGKRQLIEAAEATIEETEARYTRGEITEVERFQKVIDTWNITNESLKDQVVSNFRANEPLNSVYMMAFSGARGNISQVRQLVGMRGLMANPQGEIIDLPIKTNFREGLTVTEYIISSYGARKGLVDTALRTADSGYLTRRLVDVSQDVIIRETDCGTEKGVRARGMRDGNRVLIPLQDRLLGRLLAEDVQDPQTGEVLAQRNQAVDEELALKIVKHGVEEVLVRSPLTCEASRSVCQACYGWSLAHGHLVDIGEAVGIIAAQSIGEPGTQLTMRTFHTGGVFTGETAQQLQAPSAGVVCYPKSLRVRPFRTRHGDEAMITEAHGEVILETSQGAQAFPLPLASILMVDNGQTVQKGQMIAETPSPGRTRKTTEKAQKDVASHLAGEVRFADIVPEEKRDRQGNTTRNAQKGGLVWVLSGEVYNLPPGAEPTVKNGDQVAEGDILAQTKLVTDHGGVVRLPQEQDTAKGGREVEIVTASVLLNKASVRVESHQGREHYLLETQGDRGARQTFSLKATPGTKVQNHQVVAELIEEQYRTTTGGILKYAGVEVAKKGKAKQGYEVIRGGTLLWIAEETHEINKDISLLLVEDGCLVEPGTEVVKDIFCQIGGVVEVTEKNDILREIVIKPGELHQIVVKPEEAAPGFESDTIKTVKADLDKTLVYPGTQITPGLVAEDLRYVEYLETPTGPAVLLRPVEEYPIPDEPAVPSQESSTDTAGSICLRTVQRLPYKDGERVKSIAGVELLRTQLVLDIEKDAPQLVADIELVEDPKDPEVKRLQLVILESLVVRRDITADPTQGSTVTRLLVQEGQVVPPGAVVARTEIQCKEGGQIRGIREGDETVRRLLVLRHSDQQVVETAQKPSVAKGELIVAGQLIAPGCPLEASGQVLEVEANRVKIRLGRPYRVSPGAVLHVDDGDLVQRGDNLVLLVFERTKTGDIIQGLPRIEELLEARKPREACILAQRPGIAQVVHSDDDTAQIKVVEQDGVVTDYVMNSGQTVIISDGQAVEAGEPLTDGPVNPHDILEIYFRFYRESLGIYDAALISLQKVQMLLVGEVQSVYQSQGIDISDKHIEVVVRQMTSKVRVDDGGDTTLLPGELVELYQMERENETMAITGGAPAQYTPVLLGITKASLNTDSFISAASFQETTRVLTEAAIEGKSDWLRGLKENVIIGRLIPAGTGFNSYEDQTNGDLEGVVENGSDYGDEFALKNLVLDDRTARVYNLERGFEDRPSYGYGLLSDEGRPQIIDDEELIDDQDE